ncbi:MAG: TonB-dependent receptor [Alistipes sp.]|nr:TonB-dependent receptor [Alistipes sp.]
MLKNLLIRTFMLTVCLMALLVPQAWAQGHATPPRTVSGVVKDASGDPLTGVAVVVKGTNNYVLTDGYGQYTIANVGSGDTLAFSYIGYDNAEIAVGNRTAIDVEMKESASTRVDDVVVIGYGTTRKRDLIGAVEQIKGKELLDRPNPNVVRSLQGQVPGLTLQFTDGKPSHGATLRIRGITNSIGSGGSSLVLVDGVEGDITTINPDDIESISVLKDASSAAVYGARGAFGVILVTTKRAQADRFTVRYDGSVSILSRTVKPELVNNGLQWTEQFLESYRSSYGYDPTSINNLFPFNNAWYEELKVRDADPSLDRWRVNESGRYEYFGNTDWDKAIYKNSTVAHQHSLNFSGGNERIQFTVSGRYFSQDGIYNTDYDWYKQWNGRAKISAKIRDWWSVESNTSFVNRTYHQPMSYSGKMLIQRQWEHQGYPMQLITNPDGSWTDAAVCVGVAGLATDRSYQHNKKFDMTQNIAMTFDLVKEVLQLKGDFTYYFNQSERDRKEAIYDFKNGPELPSSRAAFDSLEQKYFNNNYLSGNVYLTWTPRLGDAHNLKVMAGWNIEDRKYNTTYAYRRGLLTDKPNFSLMDGDYYMLGDDGSYEWGFVGVFARVNYSYKDRYLFEVSGRYDGSSKFPKNSRWAIFPSGSFGWRISEEPFMENAREWLDNLKLRASVGMLGNGSVASYAYMQSMAISKGTSFLINGSTPTYTQAPSPIPDGLTWEKVITYDVGLDMDFLGNRLNFVGDVYRRDTKDMFTVGMTLPAVFGNNSPKGNYADLKTFGWEVSVAWRDAVRVGKHTLNYGIKAMVWDSRSWVTRYNNATKKLSDYYEGMEIGEIWGYRYAGLYSSAEDVAGWVDMNSYFTFNRQGNKPRPGDMKFYDLNDDGAVNNGANTFDDPGDREIIGNTSPRFCYGLNLNVGYAGFDLSLFFQGVGKRDWYPSNEAAFFWGKYNRPYSFMLQAHTGDNIYTDENQNLDAYWPRMTGYLTSKGSNNEAAAKTTMGQSNDHFLQNIAYCRLKNITLSYTFPKEMMQKIHLSGLRIYVTGENLFTWSPLRKITKNFDPEFGAGDSDFTNSTTAGDYADGYNYPMLKSVTFGINLTF